MLKEINEEIIFIGNKQTEIEMKRGEKRTSGNSH